MNTFNEWWDNIGSGIRRLPMQDNEEHAKVVSLSLYKYMTNECKNCTLYSEDKKQHGEICNRCDNEMKLFYKSVKRTQRIKL